MRAALLRRYRSDIEGGNGGDKDDEEAICIFVSSGSGGCL